MEPVTIIVTALALGAATGIKSVAEQAVKDGYISLKNLIKTKYPDVGIDRLEQKPQSQKRRDAVEEDIVDSSADKNIEVLHKAKVLLEAIENLPIESVPTIGVNLERIKGASLSLEDIIATGPGVNIQDSEFQGDISIKQVRAGGKGDKSPKD